jgi:hypothetical protein
MDWFCWASDPGADSTEGCPRCGGEEQVSSLPECLRAAERDPTAVHDAIQLVTKVAEALARTRKVVPPGGGQWTAEDIEDLVGDFFADPGRILDLAVGAKDDAHFKKRIAKTLVRVNSSTFRKTALGVLRRRVERRLAGRSDVVLVAPAHWALTPHANEPHWSGGTEPLQVAAAGVSVAEAKPQAWDSDRRPQATSIASLDAVCTAVLDRAGAPIVRPDVLAVVCERILPAAVAQPIVGDDEEPPTHQVPDADAHTGPGSALATTIWDNLTPDERELLPNLDIASRQLAAEGALGLGSSALAVRITNLRTKLMPLLEGFEDETEAARRLLELHAEWDDQRGTGQNRRVEP